MSQETKTDTRATVDGPLASRVFDVTQWVPAWHHDGLQRKHHPGHGLGGGDGVLQDEMSKQ